MRLVVIGLGNPDRGDDGAGPAVVRALRENGLAAASALAADPLDLLGLWEGAEAAVVVDATRGAGPPGTVTRMPAEQLIERGPPAVRFVSTHATDLLAALRLGAALGRIPPRVVVVGVEGASYVPGAPLSGAAQAGAEAAGRLVRAELHRLRGRRLRAQAPG